MRKLFLTLLMVVGLILAGCGEQQLYSRTGSYYNDYQAEEAEADSYTVTALAHIEEALPVVYLRTDKEVALGWELTLNSGSGDALLWVVPEEGAEHPLAGYGEELEMSISMLGRLELAPGLTRLEWSSKDGAALDFELLLTGIEDVEVQMNLDELPELPEMEPEQDVFNTDVAMISAREVNLEAAERSLLLEFAPEAAVEIELVAILDILAGDMQLVYVQPDGAEAVLWDSQMPEQGVEPLAQEELANIVLLPERTKITEDTLLFRLNVPLQPGAGHLEWQAGEAGAAYIPWQLTWVDAANAQATAVYNNGTSMRRSIE